jgi:hypothetical protein
MELRSRFFVEDILRLASVTVTLGCLLNSSYSYFLLLLLLSLPLIMKIHFDREPGEGGGAERE